MRTATCIRCGHERPIEELIEIEGGVIDEFCLAGEPRLEAASLADEVLDRMDAPERVRRCRTHHACDCLGWMAAQYRRAVDFAAEINALP